MDTTDFRLLVALFQDARQGFRALGRSVSLSHSAARDRLMRLESRGILRGFWLSVNPSVFGREDLVVAFEGDWTHQDATNALGVPEVAWVAWKVDGDLTIQVWPRDRAVAVKHLVDALGASPSFQFLAKPRPSKSLAAADWQIVDALVDNPLTPLRELAGSTGWSVKTVRRHLESLLRDRTILIVPKLGPLAESGELVYTLSVFGLVPLDQVRGVIGDAYLIGEFHDPPAKYLLCREADLGALVAKTHALEQLPGVKSVFVTLTREQLFATNFVHALIREALRALHHPGARGSL